MTGKNFIWPVLAAAFILRAGYVLSLPGELKWPDEEAYSRMARNLTEGRPFNPQPVEQWASTRPPLYPLALAAVYSLGGGVAAARLVQALVGTLTVFMVYIIGRRLLNETAGKLAAAVSAVYPLFVYFAGVLLTETLFIFLLSCVFYWTARVAESSVSGPRRVMAGAIIAGLLIGLAALTRPVALGAAAFIWAWFFLFWSDGRKSLLLGFPIAVLAAVIVLTPWTIRNYKVHGCFVPVTTQSGWVLYESANPLATGGTWEERVPPVAGELSGLSEVEWSRHLRKRAIEFIRENPARFMRLALRKQLRFWSPVPNAPQLKSRRNMLAGIFTSGFVLAFAACGAIMEICKKSRAMVLLGPVGYFTLVHSVFLGSIRYRLPIEPYLIILACGGAAGLAGRALRKSRGGMR